MQALADVVFCGLVGLHDALQVVGEGGIDAGGDANVLSLADELISRKLADVDVGGFV